MTSIQDLLPIPQGTEMPNAYDVFGLQSGEQDMDTITQAVVKVIENLKGAKEQSDPELWNQAARMVDHSRQILADPTRKSALDSKLQLVRSSAHSDPSGDPLAGLLPDGDPLAPVIGNVVNGNAGPMQNAERPQPDTVEIPPGLFGTPSQTPLPKQVSVSDQPAVQTSAQPTGRRGRRHSATGKWMLGLMILALVGTTGLLSYFLMFGQGSKQIAIAANPTNQVDEVDAADSDISEPLVKTPLDSPDPIMGKLAADIPEGRSDSFGQPSGIASGITTEDSESVESSEPPEMIDDLDSDSMSPAESIKSTAKVVALDESQQQKELEAVRSLIREQSWTKMKVAAEALTEKGLSADNQDLAQGLYELADLATFYRGGIERAVMELDVGNDFEVTDSFRVIVVDKGEDLLVVRYNKRNRSFKFDEFPFSLAHRLAAFQIPEGSTGQAAKAAYQAIASKATDAHRDQSIEWLKAIDGEIEGAEKDRLVKAIETIYLTVKE